MHNWKFRAAAVALLVVPAVSTAAVVPSTPTRWNQVFLDAIVATRTPPPIGSRALAIAHTCMFDAWAAYNGSALGTQFGAHLRRPHSEHTLKNKRAAVSYAAYRAGLDLFPSEKPRFDAMLKQLGLTPDLANAELTKPAGIANIACGEVLAQRHRDGSNQLGEKGGGPYADYTGYTPVNTPDAVIDPNRWQPLRVPTADGSSYVVQKFLVPHWGWVKPFSLRKYESYGLSAPPLYGSAAFAEETRQVVLHSATLTDKTKSIVHYWADGPGSVTPPGHWNRLAQHVAMRKQIGLDGAVKLYFALNNAMMDAGIFAWRAKRELDYVRPITAVRTLYSGKTIKAWAGYGKGTQRIPGHTWSPYFLPSSITPPFSECVSGHSTFSAAASEVLKSYTGSDRFNYEVIIPKGSSPVEPGLVPAADVRLYFATYTDAANQAGMSRLYGGIHFPIGNQEGLRVGRVIGQQAWSKARSYFGGAK